MEDSKKNAVKVGIIVVCLIAAAVIFIKTSSQDSAPTATSQMIWIKCTNEACGAEYEMNIQKYSGLMAEKGSMPPTMQAPAVVCEKCGKETANRAEKCPKCGTVFFMDNSGKCPKCGFSAGEEEQSTAAGEKQ